MHAALDDIAAAPSALATRKRFGRLMLGSMGVVFGDIGTSPIYGFKTAVSQASRGGWWVLSGCGLAVLILGLLSTSQRARRSAETTARLLNPEYLEGHTS